MTKVMRIAAAALTIGAATCLGIGNAGAQESAGDEPAACAGLPTHAQLHAALTAARDQKNGGFDLDMWGTVVNRDGVVCAVAFTGANRGSQWPGSRAISAQSGAEVKGPVATTNAPEDSPWSWKPVDCPGSQPMTHISWS